MNEKELAVLKDYFLTFSHTVAVAESVTGGMLQSVFSSMENAEKFFQGGITTYNIGQKVKHLDVEPVHAAECNCVSAETAAEMATGACALFNSTWGIGITGYATPVAESGYTLFAYYAIAVKRITKKVERIEAEFADPQKVKAFYIQTVLMALQEATAHNEQA